MGSEMCIRDRANLLGANLAEANLAARNLVEAVSCWPQRAADQALVSRARQFCNNPDLLQEAMGHPSPPTEHIGKGFWTHKFWQHAGHASPLQTSIATADRPPHDRRPSACRHSTWVSKCEPSNRSLWPKRPWSLDPVKSKSA